MTIYKYNDAVPDENLAIYKLLYRIEVGLREFIVEVLESKCGPRWWKQRLPPDVLEAYRIGREYERKIRWCELVPHHPIYYIEFPDLKKVIDRNDNWTDVFQVVFDRKDILISTLSKLEPIRNNVAHNRRATKRHLRVVEEAYDTIVGAIGEERFAELVARCTSAEGMPEAILGLRAEAESALRCCKACKPLDRLAVWDRIGSEWWFDADYLGHELNAVKEYFETLVAYRNLPQSRGSGYKIEAWVKSNELEQKYAEAMDEFAALLGDLEVA